MPEGKETGAFGLFLPHPFLPLFSGRVNLQIPQPYKVRDYKAKELVKSRLVESLLLLPAFLRKASLMSINIISNLKGYRKKKKSSCLSLGRKSCNIWPCHRQRPWGSTRVWPWRIIFPTRTGLPSWAPGTPVASGRSRVLEPITPGAWILAPQIGKPWKVTSPLGASSFSTVIKIIVLIASVFQMHHELDIHDHLQSSQPFQEAKWRLDL